MKKFNKLNQKLQVLESQKRNLSSLEDASIFQFLKYKSILSQQRKVSNQMEKIVSLGNSVNFWYEQDTKSWIENPKVNCRKYYRLERQASYKKDLTLYKLGFLNKKPLPPLVQILNNTFAPISKQMNEIFQDIKFVFRTIKFPKFNVFRKVGENCKTFTSNTLPQKINKLAVSTTMLGIKGYRMFQSDCRYIRSFINSKDSVKYMKTVLNTANIQATKNKTASNFKESLKVNSNDFIIDNAKHSSPLTKASSDFVEKNPQLQQGDYGYYL